MTMLYLARPIDRSRPQSSEIEQDFKSGMTEAGFLGFIFSPASGVTLSGTLSQADVQKLVKVNRSCLENSDALVVIYQPGYESWGVPQELLFAWSALVPIFCLLPDGVTYDGMPVYFRAWCQQDHCVYSYSELVAALELQIGEG